MTFADFNTLQTALASALFLLSAWLIFK